MMFIIFTGAVVHEEAVILRLCFIQLMASGRKRREDTANQLEDAC